MGELWWNESVSQSLTRSPIELSPNFFDGCSFGLPILCDVYFIIRGIKNANVLMSQNLKDTTDNDDYVTLAEEEMIR